MSLTRKIIIGILALVFVFSGIKLYSVLSDYKAAEKLYKDSRESFITDGGTAQTQKPEESTQPTDPLHSQSFPDMSVDFDKLLSENPDVAGWLWIEDTDISYPIMRGEDNNQYLYTGYNKLHTSSGSIFMDYKNSADFLDFNTVIYGHNMKNGTMFGSLKKYEAQEFFDRHPSVYIFTPDEDYKYTVFSAYKTESDSDSYTFTFETQQDMQDYIKLLCENSLVNSELIPKTDDRLIMLSTCTSVVRNQRFVVHGVLTGIQTH